MKLLYRLERKFGKFAIKDLMRYIIFANALVYILEMVMPGFSYNLMFDLPSILQGQVWRVFTFVFIPPDANLIFIILALYVNYLIGSSLEHEWGTFKFNIYYLLGVIGIIIGASITNLSMNNYYLNLSLFFAFAKLFPDMEFLLFFVLPVKVKYLGWISWGFFIFSVLFGPIPIKIAAITAIINYFIFFGKDIVTGRKHARSSHVRKKNFQSKVRVLREHLHKCEICGRTEQDDPDLEFRYCSKCDGQHEYCMEHLFTHTHVKNDN